VDERPRLLPDLSANLVLCGDGGSLVALKQAAMDAADALSVMGGFLLVRSDRGSHCSVRSMLTELGLSIVSELYVTEEPPPRDDDDSSSSEDDELEESVLLLLRKVG
jgi:hypothetical protein